ncbi:flavin reductase family protein [Rhodococcus sp. USK13]|uniref:flavin reductase family protein n=1 Tax=Rhodococcus sp. USK13 TaxID=2806442 RepID=UPI0020165058|nr:flavin reductase family protein [Rhodococcus sp. USK13]
MSDRLSTIDVPAISEMDYRQALGHYASGITVVTSVNGGHPIGFTCQSFYAVSMDPPLVSFSVMKTSTTYPGIVGSGCFAINVLASGQDAIANQFARSGSDKFAGVSWRPATSGNPILEGGLMWADCEMWAEHEAGDHLIVIGRVVEMGGADDRTSGPLVYYRGGYRDLTTKPVDRS